MYSKIYTFIERVNYIEVLEKVVKIAIGVGIIMFLWSCYN